MKMKIQLLLLTLGAFIALPAMASNDLTCRAVDRGSEEHWSGHRSCDECLREHGRCVETCSLDFVTCEATGRNYQGQTVSLKGTGSNRYEAERNAREYCERHFTNCSIYSCSNSSEQVSSRECIRSESPLPTPVPRPPEGPKPPAPKPPAPAPKPPAPAPKPPAPAPKPPAPAPKPPAPAPKPPAPSPKPPAPAPKPPAPAPKPPEPKPPGGTKPPEGTPRPPGPKPGNPGAPGKPGGGKPGPRNHSDQGSIQLRGLKYV